MLEATLWGLLGGASLIIGAVIGLARDLPARAIALIMGFGAGVLISAMAFDLTEEAFVHAGADAVAAGLAAGALAFFTGNRLVNRRGGAGRKRSGGPEEGAAAKGIVLGAAMDGIPESAAIGITLLGGKGVGAAVVAAVFLSNLPESLSASTGLRRAGHSARWILGLWIAVALLSGLAAGLGYALLEGASEDVVGGIQAFAAGAILVMVTDTMMPEAVKNGGDAVGLVAVLGFATAFLLSTLG